MNGDLSTFDGRQNNDFEEIARAVGTDDQPSVGVLAGVFGRKYMIDSVEEVVVRDPVLTRRVMDFHSR